MKFLSSTGRLPSKKSKSHIRNLQSNGILIKILTINNRPPKNLGKFQRPMKYLVIRIKNSNMILMVLKVPNNPGVTNLLMLMIYSICSSKPVDTELTLTHIFKVRDQLPEKKLIIQLAEPKELIINIQHLLEIQEIVLLMKNMQIYWEEKGVVQIQLITLLMKSMQIYWEEKGPVQIQVTELGSLLNKIALNNNSYLLKVMLFGKFITSQKEQRTI